MYMHTHVHYFVMTRITGTVLHSLYRENMNLTHLTLVYNVKKSSAQKTTVYSFSINEKYLQLVCPKVMDN